MEEKYIVWHIEGGLGKNVAATSLMKTLKERYPNRKLIVVATYPEIFLNNSHIDRVYRVGNTHYFYDDYIKDKDTIIYRHEAYYETNHILRRKHLIDNWCQLMDLEYDGQIPEVTFNFVQKRNSFKWSREKPILVIQTNGGLLTSETEYSWTRDLPFQVALSIAEKYKGTHHIIQICKPNSKKIENVEVIDNEMSSMELFGLLLHSDKRIFIDSCLQHAAAGLNLPSTVFWIGTSPKNFGYVMHNNIVANPPSGNVKLINSYLFDYAFDGIVHECPYITLEEIFDIPKRLDLV
jgi:ADP-heptose:LPS heptosyltransferase